MFAVGIDIDARTYFSSVTGTIALPTAIKLFSWLTSLLRSLLGRAALKLIYTFIICFVIGGVTGLLMANSELDIALHDSYFVVAHFHYVLSLGALFGLMVGVCCLYYCLTGNYLTEHLARLVVLLVLLGTSAVFWPMHASGLLGCPRRISDYSDQYVGYSGGIS